MPGVSNSNANKGQERVREINEEDSVVERKKDCGHLEGGGSTSWGSCCSALAGHEY